MNNVTIAFNEAGFIGGGISINAAPPNLPTFVRLSNTIIAKNSAEKGADCEGGELGTRGFNTIENIFSFGPISQNNYSKSSAPGSSGVDFSCYERYDQILR